VAVAAPVIVAALVSRNGAVAVINARERARNMRRVAADSIENELYEHGFDLLERIVAMLTKLIEP
jgi:hypothetical protein